MTTHPGGNGFPRVSRVESLGPQAVQPTNPVPLPGGGEQLEVLLSGFPIVLHVVLLVDILEREDRVGEGRGLIGKSEMQGVLEVLALMPMLHRPFPDPPDGLTDIPATGREMEQAADPAAPVPNRMDIREVGSPIDRVLVAELKTSPAAGLVPASTSWPFQPLPPGIPCPRVLVPPISRDLRLMLVEGFWEWKRPLVQAIGLAASRLPP